MAQGAAFYYFRVFLSQPSKTALNRHTHTHTNSATTTFSGTRRVDGEKMELLPQTRKGKQGEFPANRRVWFWPPRSGTQPRLWHSPPRGSVYLACPLQQQPPSQPPALGGSCGQQGHPGAPGALKGYTCSACMEGTQPTLSPWGGGSGSRGSLQGDEDPWHSARGQGLGLLKGRLEPPSAEPVHEHLTRGNGSGRGGSDRPHGSLPCVLSQLKIKSEKKKKRKKNWLMGHCLQERMGSPCGNDIFPSPPPPLHIHTPEPKVCPDFDKCVVLSISERRGRESQMQPKRRCKASSFPPNPPNPPNPPLAPVPSGLLDTYM